jgi:hypothetical protein
MSDVKQYPTWQKELRAMQAVRDENHAKAQAKEKEEKADTARKVGLNLSKALMHFGIYIETPPVVNSVEIDGYTFRLFQGKYQGDKAVNFTLVVAKAIPGRDGEDKVLECYRQISVNTMHFSEEVKWDYYLCQLADAFDALDESVAYEVARDAQWKQDAEARRLNPPEKRESEADQLVKLLRSIMRDIFEEQAYS